MKITYNNGDDRFNEVEIRDDKFNFSSEEMKIRFFQRENGKTNLYKDFELSLHKHEGRILMTALQQYFDKPENRDE